MRGVRALFMGVSLALLAIPAGADETRDLVRIDTELEHVMRLVDQIRERTPAAPDARIRFRFDRLQAEIDALRQAIDAHLKLMASEPKQERFHVE